jgi:hypothetical protein
VPQLPFARLTDIHDRRLGEMDAHSIEMLLLSLNAPTVQAVAAPGAAISTLSAVPCGETPWR